MIDVAMRLESNGGEQGSSYTPGLSGSVFQDVYLRCNGNDVRLEMFSYPRRFSNSCAGPTERVMKAESGNVKHAST